MARPLRREAADWLGLPVLPPAGLVDRLGPVRQRLHRATESGPPFVVVLERLVSVYDNVVLGVLCRHGIPEAVVEASGTAEDLARRIGGDDPLDPDALHRLLRYAAARGFVDRDRHGAYEPNEVTRALTTEVAGSARAWVDFLTSRSTWQILAEVDEAVHGRDPCRAAHGTDFFTHANDRSPAEGAAFNAAMQQGSHIQGLLLADAVDFSTTRSVVDVGGGTGSLARVLLRHHPTLEVTVFDLPSVIASAQADPDHGPAAWPPEQSVRCRWVGGDFFESVPAGGDTYTLLAVLHDWSDADASRILGNVRAAMGGDGRCVVVDSTIDGRRPQDLAVATDLLMLLLTDGGRERTATEWEDLVHGSGLRIVHHHRLATGFSAYELAAR